MKLNSPEATSPSFEIPRARFACLLLAMVTLLLYWPVREHEFLNYDDNRYVTDDPHIRRGLTAEGLIWAFTDTHFYMWHPLTTLSHLLDVTLFGMNPAMHHLVNVFLHTGNTVLVFLLIFRLTTNFWPAVIMAGLFAWHPLRVESVAWVAERKDVLSGFFWLLTLLAYTRYAQQPSTRRYWLAAGTFALAILTKPMVITLPFVLLLLDWWPLNRLKLTSRGWPDSKSLTALVKEKIPFFALTLLLGILTVAAQKSGDVLKPLEELSVTGRISNALVSYARYLGKAVWPTDLIVFYPHPGAWQWWQIGGSILLLGAITCAVIAWRRERPYLAVGWFWFLGTLVPVIGIVQAGGQAMADRYTYIPMLGVALACVWGILNSNLRNFPRLLRGLTIIVALGCLVGTRLQLRHWQSSETLFRHTLNVSPDNPIALANLAGALLDQHRYDEVGQMLTKALKTDPDDARTWLHLGLAHFGVGRTKEAMACYQKSLELEPDNTMAQVNMGNALMRIGRPQEAITLFEQIAKRETPDADVLNNWGLALSDLGRNTEAIEKYEAALGVDPEFARAHQNLGLALADLGRAAEAEQHYRTALSLQPNFVEAHSALGYLFASQKKHPEAIAEFRSAIEADPTFVIAHAGLGMCLGSLGRYAEAIPPLREAVRLDPMDPSRREQLAMALRRAGDFHGALEVYRETVKGRPNDPMALNQLARFLAAAPQPEVRRPEESIPLAQRACELTQNKIAEPLDTLAMAQAQAGQFKVAIETAARALELAKQATNAALTAAIEQRIELFRQGKAYSDAQ